MIAMSLFEKDLLDLSYWDLLELIASRRTKQKIEDLFEDPCKSRFLKNIRLVKEEDGECRFSSEFAVRIALAALTWIVHIAPDKTDVVKDIISKLLEIYSEVG